MCGIGIHRYQYEGDHNLEAHLDVARGEEAVVLVEGEVADHELTPGRTVHGRAHRQSLLELVALGLNVEYELQRAS